MSVTALENICRNVESNGPWKDQPVSNLQQYWTYGSQLDRRILKISYPLLRATEEKFEFMRWLRSIPDDEAFAISIETARNLQDMDVPDDLKDSSKRVGEKFLAMISNIRNYLHARLYAVDHLIENYEQFLKILSEYNEITEPEFIISNIEECDKVRASLSSIIGVKKDSAGVSRLGKLYSPEFSAVWRCLKNSNSSEAGNDGSVILRYLVS
jgi:hypothetical protein